MIHCLACNGFLIPQGRSNPAEHYILDPLSRWNLSEILTLIDQRKYFLVHASRQTGKTTCLQAFLQRIINGGGSIHREYALGRGRSANSIVLKFKVKFLLVEKPAV